MRCKNCGWENPEGRQNCEKCNTPLQGGNPVSYQAPQSPAASSPQQEVLRGTVHESDVFGSAGPAASGSASSGMSQCPHCGYPVRPGMDACPNCNEPIAQSPASPQAFKPQPPQGNRPAPQAGFAQNPPKAGGNPRYMGTVNPWSKPQNSTFCTLRPISWENENIQHEAKTYSGESVELNRANTDPNNQSITSKVQAELTFENGEWYIEDKSTLKTTYLHVARKTKLEDGDIIILGNRQFEFKA